MGEPGVGNGFGYLLSEGSLSTRIPFQVRLQSPDTGASGSRKNWKGALGAYYSQHWAGVKGEERLTTSPLATFFFKRPHKTLLPEQPAR